MHIEDFITAKGERVKPTGNPNAKKAVDLHVARSGIEHFEKGYHGWFHWGGLGKGWSQVTDVSLINHLDSI